MPERDDAPLCLGPDSHPRPPGFAMPPDACDSHAHVIGPLALFPLQSDRSYTPPEAPLGAYRHMLETLGLKRGVLVQPSIFGTDNSCMLQALARHRNTLRGIAAVDPTVDEAELESLASNGIKGLRLNMLFRGGVSLDHLERLAARVERLQWHLELLLDIRELPALLPRLTRLPVEIVIDHLGHMPAAEGIGHPGFQSLLTLVRGGRCWVKLSGAYRVSSSGAPFHDTVPFVQALVDADPTRLVWGTDWPHTAMTGSMVSDGDLLDLLAHSVPQPRLRHLILVENPARLYGFGEG
ncbi:MAG: amidohydrolase family protein [Aliidongia sp.]